MSLIIRPRPKETKTQARERIKTNLSAALSCLEKGMGPLDADSDDCEELQKAYDIIDSIFCAEFE